MSWSFRLLRIQGIDIRVHVTFVLILIWAAYYWSVVVDDGLRGAIFGVIATLLLFVCVTLHELGHSFQAKAYGIDVEDITLLPIGGLARLGQIPKDPKQEFRIAVAGPLVNVVIAVLLIAVTVILGRDTFTSPGALIRSMQTGDVGALLDYLLFANIALVLFNIIPAFPMDGGRILRSLLAMRISHARATQIAASIGQAMALLLGLFGFATGNFFLILIAIFIWFGAGQENAMVQMADVLGGALVGQVMSRAPHTLGPNETLQQAVALTLTTTQSDFPVIDRDGYVTGILTLDGLLKGLQERADGRVAEAMRHDALVARPDERLTEAQDRLATSGQRTMVVLDNSGHLVGMLTAADIAEALRLFSAQPDLARSFLRPNAPPRQS
jgi:Zn-dependent protease/CBS domain-containing protein